MRKPLQLEEKLLLPVSVTDETMRRVLSERFFEGTARRIWAWCDPHRTFGSMDLKGWRRNHLVASLRGHRSECVRGVHKRWMGRPYVDMGAIGVYTSEGKQKLSAAEKRT